MRTNKSVSVAVIAIVSLLFTGCDFVSEIFGGKHYQEGNYPIYPKSEADDALVDGVRKALFANDRLSTPAKSVEIVVTDGNVTLRGDIRWEEERAMLTTAAESIAGSGRVTNLTVVR